jgi:DNA-binding transcriptional regulator YhcF (GntR family)
MDTRVTPSGTGVTSTEPTARRGAKYLGVADHVRREIQTGHVKPNQYLTVAEVAAAHRVGADTARHALGTLHAEGYLARTDRSLGYRVAEAMSLPVARAGSADTVCRHCGKAADESGYSDIWAGYVWLPPIRVRVETRDVLQAGADARNSSLADHVAGALAYRTANPSVSIPAPMSEPIEEMAKASGRSLKAEILYALELHTQRPAATQPNR